MPPKSAAEKAIPPTQDYPPNASSSYPAPCCVSRMDIPVAHLPRDVGLQHIAPFSTKEKEKAKEKKNEKGGGREVAPPMVFFGLKFSRKDDSGELKTFLAKTCSYQQIFRQPPL